MNTRKMKNVKVVFCLIAVILAMSAENIFGLEFKDGGIHNIDYTLPEGDVYVDYLVPGMQTTINLLKVPQDIIFCIIPDVLASKNSALSVFSRPTPMM